MKDLLPYIVVDLLLVVALPLMMLRRLSFWHPCTIYWVFHFYSFTMRAIALFNGAAPMYWNNPMAAVVLPAEFQRAMFWADVGLVIFFVAAYAAHLHEDRITHVPVVRRPLSRNAILAVCIPCLPIGFTALYVAKANLVTSDSIAESGYFQTAGIWPIGCIGMLVCLYGFRWYLVAMGLLYLGTVALQGYHRFMLLLPLIFFVSYYLQSRRRRWPQLTIIVAAVLMAIIFPRLKYIGRAYQNGDYGEAFNQLVSSFSETKGYEENVVGEDFLDQYAGGLTMMDEYGKFYYGQTFLAILTLPIPRAAWPNKPGLADHMYDISTNVRQYSTEGRILTYLGEAYPNFGYVGLLLIPALLGWGLTRWCIRATTGPLQRLNRYVYLAFFIALLQLFRDGLLSLFVFSVVHNIPMLIMWVFHLIPGVAPKLLDAPSALENRPAEPMPNAPVYYR